MSALYTIYAPADEKPDKDPHISHGPRAIADKFSWYAFLLTPIWALRHAGWPVFFVWLVLVIAIFALNSALPFDTFWANLLLGAWFGFAASELAGQSLKNKGYTESGFLLASSQLEAEVLAISAIQEMVDRNTTETA